MRTLPRLLTVMCVSLLASALAFGAISQAGAAPSASAAARAHAASSYLTGIGDESPKMFGNSLCTQLHTKIVRYVAPYDAVAHSYSLDQAINFIKAAEAAHQQVLVAFYHSEYSPTKLPSVSAYQRDVQKFVKLLPPRTPVRVVGRGQPRQRAARSSRAPRRAAAAKYYQALLRVCKGCTVIGLDVLDAYNISPTLSYISEFKREIGRLQTVMPKIWGLHNYSDVNRLESWRTRQLVKRARRPGVADRDRRAS